MASGDLPSSQRTETLRRIDVQTNLTVIPLSEVHVTETVDTRRVADLERQFDASNALNEPIQIIEKNGRWWLLNGHTRDALFLRRQLPYILAQVQDGPVEVATWILVSNGSPDTSCLRRVTADEFASYVDLYGGIVDLAEETFYLFNLDDESERLSAQRRQVEHLVAGNGGEELKRFEDTNRAELHTIEDWRAESERKEKIGRTLLVYPLITFSHFMELVLRGECVPSGMTRFILSYAVLEPGVPLDLFDAANPFSDVVDAVSFHIAKHGFRVKETER